MGPGVIAFHDLDHVVLRDGRICRVVGNLNEPGRFLGYNVYSPSDDGDRSYRGVRYRKNFIEDERLPEDAMDVYELLPTADVLEHHEPIESAHLKNSTFGDTIWFDLYRRLVDIFGVNSVGIFGSAMFGLHLTLSGKVRKDVDFVIQGRDEVGVLRKRLPQIRDDLGFAPVSAERQRLQSARYEKVFRNSANSLDAIISRRWSGLQLTEDIVTTIRFRDPNISTPIGLVGRSSESYRDVVVSGRVTHADDSNMFPRRFKLHTDHGMWDIYTFWWKFSTPVRDGDLVTVRGSLLTLEGRPVIRLSNFVNHWLKIL